MYALSKPTSICGTSHRQVRVQPYPTQKLPLAHLQQPGTGRRCKCCGEGGSNKPTPVPHAEDALPVD